MTASAWPTADLLDDVLVTYHDWRADAASVDDAYDKWRETPRAEEARRFAAYTAALEQEEKAASAYARAIATLERRMSPPRVAR